MSGMVWDAVCLTLPQTNSIHLYQTVAGVRGAPSHHWGNIARAWERQAGWSDFASRSCQNRETHGLKLILSAFWLEVHSVCLPPITRSIACSKCFWFMESERCLAAIRAASLQTLATSAPTTQMCRTAYPPNKLGLISHTHYRWPHSVSQPATDFWERV